jgi:hypothetical protein
MSEEQSAALEEDVITKEPQEANEDIALEPNAESAPVDAEAQSKEDGFQKRINKVTADKYAEKRRADELQKRIEELEATKVQASTGDAPKLEDFDFDQDKFNQALIDHRVNAAIAASQAKQAQEAVQARTQETARTYEQLVTELGKDDFYEVANNIPVLDQGLVAELMSTKEGVEMIYHLGSHLDVADKIANMPPLQAMGELGRISAGMSAQPQIKPSAAPDPIEPLNSGGSISTERGPSGATFE